jgi:Domain of unknown function (DUF4214)
MRTTMSRLLAGLILASLVGGFFAATAPTAPAQAANAATFDPGLIIDDRLFYDGSLMPEASIQSFLDGKVATCGVTAGNPGCLEIYRADSTTRDANAYCGRYEGGTGELASRILYKVAIACNINPQVLIVTLQKEQGLVTATNPTAAKYQKAMGYGCPDTSVCDAKYYGFANQLYSAAWQFNYYRANPTRFNYRAGQVNTIKWNPNATCGTSDVFIQNSATAGLYTYTPYRPNQAALNNLYGTGDGCSSYGNRNFWSYFTDWFGSTLVSPGAVAFVKALYLDILNRAPGDSEVTFWGRLIMNGMSPTAVASGFVNSDEYRLIRITAAYRTDLGREGETTGVYNWLDLMKRGVLQTDDVDKYFMASDEYMLRSGGTTESFVSAMYQQMLGRPVTSAEIPFWTGIATASGRLVVVDGIWHSIESSRARVTIMYSTYLGRMPDEAGVASWANIAIASGDATVRWQIIGSLEYWNRASGRFPI